MSALQTMTDMLIDSSPAHERHIYQTYNLINQLILEKVPPMIDEYFKNNIDDYVVNVITTLNGKQSDLSGLRADISELIMAQMSKWR